MGFNYPLPEQVRETAVLNCNGVSTTYGPFDFKIFDEADITVYRKRVGETLYSILTTVTVTKQAALAFDYFTITFPSVEPATTKFKVASERVHSRSIGVDRGTGLNVDALDKELSKQATILQELVRNFSTRLVQIDVGQTALTIDPGIVDGDTLMKSGNRLVKGASATDITNAQSYASQALVSKNGASDAMTAAAASATQASNIVGGLGTLTAAVANASTSAINAAASASGSFINAKADTTISAARARVADGETFLVITAALNQVDAYRRDSSTTQTYLATYTTALAGLPPESGWLFGIQDTANGLSFGVNKAGQIWLNPASDFPRIFPTGFTIKDDFAPESGFLYAIGDTSGNLGFGLKKDGTFWAKPANDFQLSTVAINAIKSTTISALLPTSDIVAWGDSLTAGAGGSGTIYTAVLATALGRSVNNQGIGGQNSQAIATRQGGLKMLVSVTSNQIPASGAVTLTARSQTPITNQGPSSFTGTLAGVPGTLAASTSDGGVTYTYTFTRTTTGSIVSCPVNSEFIFDIAETAKGATGIIWSGRNDVLSTRAAVIATRDNILVMADKLSVLNKRFLVMSVLNGAGETTGTGAFNQFAALNAELLATFGDRFVDVRSYLVNFGLADAGITPISQDNTDVAGNTVPVSLRSDGIHLNAAGYTLVGNFIARQIRARGW